MLRVPRLDLSKYVIPDIVEQMDIDLGVARSRKLDIGDIQRIHENILKEVHYTSGTVDSVEKLHPLMTLSSRRGNCLQISILEASVLRGLGLSEHEVYMITLLHKGESVFEALHAVCGVFTEALDKEGMDLKERLVMLDPSERRVRSVSLLELSSVHKVHVLFNDGVAFLCV